MLVYDKQKSILYIFSGLDFDKIINIKMLVFKNITRYVLFFFILSIPFKLQKMPFCWRNFSVINHILITLKQIPNRYLLLSEHIAVCFIFRKYLKKKIAECFLY